MEGLPQSYAEWKQCIEVDCDTPLTAGFCERRIAALNDENDPHTASFKKKYGEEHLRRVVGWFEQALVSDVPR